jgi:nucleoside-diphosphate-sugar epimerase
MATKVLLTGAAGLVGRSVALRLRNDGIDFLGIDISGEKIDGVEVVQCDVRDIQRLHEITLQQKPTAVIHCGAYSGPMLGLDNPAAVISLNVGGTANLLDVSRIHGIRRFIFCSSVSAVGPTIAPVDENVVLRPTTVYGATKAACEHLVSAYRYSFGIEAVCLRLTSVWGPNRKTACVLGAMIKNTVANRETRMEAGGYSPTQYLHVDDAADAIVRALQSDSLQQHAYNIAGDRVMPLSDVAAIVRYVLPGAKITVGPGSNPLWEWQSEFLLSAASRDLGFTPRVSLEDGIRAFAQAAQTA